MLRRLILILLCLTAGAVRAEQPLPPEQAFRFSARAIDANTIEAHWDIAKGYYLYRNKFQFSVQPATIKLGAPKIPAGKIHEDENFGKVETYRDEVSILIPLTHAEDHLTLDVVSQGCADIGVCYPPQPQQASLQLPTAATISVPQAPLLPLADAVGNNENSRIARLLKQGNSWLILTSFFGFGLLLCFTPCVLPMVPILSGIIVNHGHAVTHARAFLLSLAYVLGMAITYSAAGVAAGYSGTLLSSALQNAWVLGGFALLFVGMSLSMFGFYELQLPGALQARLSSNANRQGGSLHAIAMMGALSALIVGPCVAAPLAGALLYIAQTGNAVLGGTALFALALGMGVPLLAVGMFSRSLLPTPGPWMEAVKKFFGVLLLATALWLVSPVIPAWALMLGWAALLIVPAMYLHALDPLPPHAHGWQRFWKGIGVAMLLAGAAMLLGSLGGARDPLQPLDFLKRTATPDSHAARFVPVRTLAELDAQLEHAGKPVLLDFYADWCVSCKEMERDTFSDSRVSKKLDKLLLLQVDVTANTQADKALLRRFGLFGPPGILFFDAHGTEIPDSRVIGYETPDSFLSLLDRIAS